MNTELLILHQQRKSLRIEFAVFLLGCSLCAGGAEAHNGRGFEIEVVARKLQAQGVNPTDFDGLPAVRPYVNSIHDHWRYIPSLGQSVASLPEFEVTPQVAFSFLDSYALDLELVGAYKWSMPPAMPLPDTVPTLKQLDASEILTMQTLGAPISSNTLGTLALSASVPPSGTGDIVPLYSIGGSPQDRIHILHFVLSATPPDNTYPEFLPSDPIFVILSPDGLGPFERLHHASLYIERYLAINGLPIPEPSTLALLASPGALLCIRRDPSCR